MPGFSDYLELEILDHIFVDGGFSQPANLNLFKSRKSLIRNNPVVKAKAFSLFLCFQTSRNAIHLRKSGILFSQ